ncbi:hypothetical protein Salat_1405100 [Sesamum alatum]|uniref:EF-hand domain-containing protein n=1 Tax=Sesamum alatum TaxID=300844 RepID=A0AAE2CLA2_9LAMI|nr:hypothetical protein Salat_1405100 [Sesamum alatum]
MAIFGCLDASSQARRVPSGGKVQMTADDFKKWLMGFDDNKDGRISRSELKEAIRSRGKWFSGRKSGHGMNVADANGDGYIDEHEINSLLDFAQRNLGFQFYL